MSLSQLLIPGCESTDVSLWLLGVSVNVLSARLPHLLPHCPTPPSPSEQVRLLYWGRNYEIEIEAREAIETSRLGSRVGHHLPIPGCPGKSSAMQEQIFRGATWKSIHLSHGNIQKGNMKIHLPHTSLKFRNVIFTETDFAVHSIQLLELPIPLSSSVSYKNLDHFPFYRIARYFPTLPDKQGLTNIWLGLPDIWPVKPDIWQRFSDIWPALPDIWPWLSDISLRLPDIWPG